MRLAVVIQARMASQRLPGKVMLDLAGAPLLERMVERVRAARTPFETIVATSVDASCDPIEALCQSVDVRCYRGDPLDLLDRHFRAAQSVQADAVAKIPSDCPLIDPRVIDRVLSVYLRGEADFVSNLHPPTYPDGNDVEVMSMQALETAWLEAKMPHEREHTTPFIWDNPERFSLQNVVWEAGKNYAKTQRWTIDYVEDYRLIRSIYEALYSSDRPIFTLDDILSFLDENPQVRATNERWLGTSWHQQHLGDFRNGALLGEV